MKQSVIGWSIFVIFVASALSLQWHDSMLQLTGVMGVAKGVVWVAFLFFTAYSLYCSSKENLFKSLQSIAEFYWGRQVGIDLYLGLLLFLAMIYLHQGFVVFLLWLVPVLLFANLATLLYVAIHFESLVASFIG